jgi:2-dehydropantoate 2-reductase
VYGYHLQRGGARVALFVRARAAAAACEQGTVLYPLTRRRERRPVTFKPDAVLTSLDDVAAAAAVRPWDEVWFCVPADALEETWLASVARAVGHARIVALPPGTESEELLRRAFPDCEVVPAMIGMVSYQAPLPGEDVPVPGIAFYFPPGGPSAFGGPQGKAVAKELVAGGCPAVAKMNVGTSSAFGSAVLMPVVAGLEASDWSLRGFRRSNVPTLVAAAAHEALAITAAKAGVAAPFLTFLVGAFVLKLAAWLAPKLAPFDLEAYLRHHFGKVGGQTRLLVAAYEKEAAARGLESSALGSLIELANARRDRSSPT